MFRFLSLLLCGPLSLCVLCRSDALAQPATSDTAAPRHEAQRLVGEIDRLAQRNAWVGVERMYTSAVALQQPLPHRTHLHAASAARDVGDIGAVRTRLQQAYAASHHRETRLWLEGIEARYGQVALYLTPGSTFDPVERPWAPDEQSAISLAHVQLAEAGRFDGWLPIGRYSVGGMVVDVPAFKPAEPGKSPNE